MNKSNYKIAEGQLERPFIVRENGQCPYCGSTIIVLQSEITSTVLSKEGSPIAHNVEYSRMYGYCEACNTKMPVVKDGYNFTAVIDLDFKLLIDKIFGKKHEDVVIPAEENPFGFNGGLKNDVRRKS